MRDRNQVRKMFADIKKLFRLVVKHDLEICDFPRLCAAASTLEWMLGDDEAHTTLFASLADEYCRISAKKMGAAKIYGGQNHE